jgi:hypothetical protein
MSRVPPPIDGPSLAGLAVSLEVGDMLASGGTAAALESNDKNNDGLPSAIPPNHDLCRT